MHPETRAKVAGALARHGKSAQVPSIAASLAAATGQSERSARRHIAECKNLSATELTQVRGTALDDEKLLKQLDTLPLDQRSPLIEAALRREPVVPPLAVVRKVDQTEREPKVAEGGRQARQPASTEVVRTIVEHAKAFLAARSGDGGLDPPTMSNAVSLLETGGWKGVGILAELGEALARALTAERHEQHPAAGQLTSRAA